ncbi:MAG: glycine oxidase ThiO [Synechococcaceae cyanobacterium SM2_3_1]|nr:glycine oxidase ThiO [Synechococcaceae cyanobacterium SM2_3_1]
MRIAIVGGGVVGLAIGWQLARRGYSTTVFERKHIGCGASGVAGGMLAAQAEAEPGEEALHQLLLQSQRMWPTFAQDLELASSSAIGYRREGTLLVAVNRDEQERLKAHHQYQQSLGLNLTWLSGYEVRQREPYLSRQIVGALYSPEDHQVDNRLLLQALKTAFLQAGGILREQCLVEALLIKDDQIYGLRNQDQEWSAEFVILATAAWPHLIHNLNPYVDLPIRPCKGQILTVQMPPHQILTAHVIWGEDVYLIPRGDGRLLIGATVEEKGYDPDLTVGGVLDLLQKAWEILPGLYDMPIRETQVGFRPRSPDDAPILGPTPLKGLYLATGHHRNGILLAPLLAQAITPGRGSGGLPPGCQSFTLDRFHTSGFPDPALTL